MDTTYPNIAPGLQVRYRKDAPVAYARLRGNDLREVSSVGELFAQVVDPSRRHVGTANTLPLDDFWTVFEPITEDAEKPASTYTPSKGDRVRVADTDLRVYLRGYVGTVARVSGGEVRVNMDTDQPKPNGYSHDGWGVKPADLELLSVDPLADSVSKDQERTYVRTTALLAGIMAPGFYTIGADENGRLRVESFTSATVLEKDGPDEPAGVWVVYRGNEDQTVSVLTIHDDELDAYRHAVGRGNTYVRRVEFGAAVPRMVSETDDL